LSASLPKTSADEGTSRMDEKTIAFLRKTFREHYFRHHDGVEIPTMIESREFGYTPFGRGMVRHLSYKSSGELVADLVKQAPSSVFCSNGTYSDPTLPMEDKGWKGAELIFDIDANDIPTACRNRHNFFGCRDCGKMNNAKSSERPQRCSRCQGTSLTQLHWSCPECLEAAKEHASRLMTFLTGDFGVPAAAISVYFSGNRGYHLHVEDRRFEAMDSSARAEVAKYIKGTGLIRRQGPEDAAGGWPARLSLSTGRDQSQKLDQMIGEFSPRIDESVTTDIHRIFRMPGTLHGGSGLLKMKVHDLRAFRPELDPVVLGDEEVTLSVSGAPAFALKGRTFGPFSSEEPELPTFAAVYLLTKGLARVAG
jgi:DNA primase small subunit